MSTTDESLIRVKLKRKLEYKGHHMCQDVNPSNIRQALVWLKDNNPNYEDIRIDFQQFDAMVDDQLMHDEQYENSQQNTGDKSFERQNVNIDEQNVIEEAIATEVYRLHEELGNNSNNLPPDANDNDATDYSDNASNVEDTFGDEPLHDLDNNDNEVNDINQERRHLNGTDEDRNDDITNTSTPLYSFLHAADFAQYLADKHDESILSVAPGEGNKPQKVIEMESKCFPVEFPDGSNTFKEKRKQKISLTRYYNSRLFSSDNRFARNPEYIFFALYTKEVEQIHSGISIAIRTGSTKTASGQEITASMLRDHEQVKRLIQRDEGYRFMKKIRGSPAFWEDSKRELFAMIRQLGIPTFFVTFSAADRR